MITILRKILLAVALIISQNSFSFPFAPTSIWNRTIQSTAVYTDVSDALWGSPANSPGQIYLDLITILYVDPQSTPVNIRINSNWDYPYRAQPASGTLYQRKLGPTAGVQESTDNGNGIVVIIDPLTGQADEGGAMFRDQDSNDLLIFQDRPALHYNVFTGSGLYNGVRGSGLSGLGGVIQAGEINTVIPHALAIMTSGRIYSKNTCYVWPATRCDSIAKDPTYGYKGPNNAYTLGTFLAIPPSINLSTIKFKTKQGYTIAIAAQKYGMYVVDSSAATGNRVGLSMDYQAAVTDLGLVQDPVTAYQSVDSKKIDGNAFQADIISILHMVKAVINNKP
jgi:hypothetical protein